MPSAAPHPPTAPSQSPSTRLLIAVLHSHPSLPDFRDQKGPRGGWRGDPGVGALNLLWAKMCTKCKSAVSGSALKDLYVCKKFNWKLNLNTVCHIFFVENNQSIGWLVGCCSHRRNALQIVLPSSQWSFGGAKTIPLVPFTRYFFPSRFLSILESFSKISQVQKYTSASFLPELASPVPGVFPEPLFQRSGWPKRARPLRVFEPLFDSMGTRRHGGMLFGSSMVSHLHFKRFLYWLRDRGPCTN